MCAIYAVTDVTTQNCWVIKMFMDICHFNGYQQIALH